MQLLQLGDPKIESLDLEKLSAYVRQAGWKLLDHPNQKLQVFQGPDDDDGLPIKLVLPQSRHFWDSPIMLTKAVNLLAEIEERSPNEILLKIQQVGDATRRFI
jgi:hypothetical protein